MNSGNDDKSRAQRATTSAAEQVRLPFKSSATAARTLRGQSPWTYRGHVGWYRPWGKGWECERCGHWWSGAWDLTHSDVPCPTWKGPGGP